MTILRVENVSKAYGETAALNGVSLDVAAGEVCGLIGANGAGKSTLFSIVAGLRRPDAGTILIDGRDSSQRRKELRHVVGFAPQDVGIYPTLTVKENLAVFGEILGVGRRQIPARVEGLADSFDLTSLLSRSAHALSGGEKRRLHAAAAIMHRPRLLLLDEPTAGVDMRTRSRVLGALRRLADDEGTAICYSTHYLPELDELDASVAIIDQGKLVARGTRSGLLRDLGQSAVEVTFESAVPMLPFAAVTNANQNTATVYTDEPAKATPQILAELGDNVRLVASVRVITPNLDNVFLALTGQRLSSD